MTDLAYFDNAATTFPKPEIVYSFADSFYRTRGGNAGRGNNTLASAAKKISIEAKNNIRALYKCASHEVVFTSSATEALNRILFGIGLVDGDTVLITPFEHNAVTRPLTYLQKTLNINLETLSFDLKSLLPNMEKIDNQLRTFKPKILVITHASNVCGAIISVEDIAKLAKGYGAITVVDMSQTCGLIPLDLTSSHIDFAVFAGHKTLYAPFGIGGFICSSGTTLNPVLFGGNGINSIEQEMPVDIVSMSEIGSQNVYAIAGLKASTDWLLEHGWKWITKTENSKKKHLINMLRKYKNVHIICDSMECERIGIVSTLFDGFSPDEIEQILENCNVAVRSGLHCAPFAHRFLNTLPAGTVRFSISCLTQEEDFFLLERALDSIRDAS